MHHWAVPVHASCCADGGLKVSRKANVLWTSCALRSALHPNLLPINCGCCGRTHRAEEGPQAEGGGQGGRKERHKKRDVVWEAGGGKDWVAVSAVAAPQKRRAEVEISENSGPSYDCCFVAVPLQSRANNVPFGS